MLSAKTCGQHNKVIDSVSTIRLIVLISVVLSFLVGRGSLLIQCQEFEILFIPFISASILIICCAYINNVQSYAIICKIYPFCPFFFIFAAFLGKNRGRRRVFCHSKQFILRPFAHRPLAQKVAQLLSRRSAKLAQICRRHPPSSPPHPPSSPPYPPSSLPLHPSSSPHPPSSLPHPPSSLPIVFEFFAASSVLTAISSILPLPPFIFSAAPAVLLAILTLLSATAPILPATNYKLVSGHEIMNAKHDFIISCPETTVSRLAIILKRAAGAMALVSAQGVVYAGDRVITINRI